MIMEREVAKYGNYLLHTTLDDGYSFPNFENIAKSYGIEYLRVNADKVYSDFRILDKPQIMELIIDKNTQLQPSLPVGNPCQDLSPEISRELYSKLDSL